MPTAFTVVLLKSSYYHHISLSLKNTLEPLNLGSLVNFFTFTSLFMTLSHNLRRSEDTPIVSFKMSEQAERGKAPRSTGSWLHSLGICQPN